MSIGILGGSGVTVRVLILEDDPFIALDLCSIVEAEGHEVVSVCASLAQARTHLADAFDFALLDIDLADGKSFDVASVLADREIPFAFVSASQRSEVPLHLRGARFIPKPYEEAAILRSLPVELPAVQ
jgi:DNA-binding response OmpR family regulator